MPMYLPSKAAVGALFACALSLPGLPAHAADKVKVGFVSTLSGPSSALGIDIRDGFLLAVKLNGGKLEVRNLPGMGCIFTIDLPRPWTAS